MLMSYEVIKKLGDGHFDELDPCPVYSVQMTTEVCAKCIFLTRIIFQHCQNYLDDNRPVKL